MQMSSPAQNIQFYELANGLSGYANLNEIADLNEKHHITLIRPATVDEATSHLDLLELNPWIVAA